MTMPAGRLVLVRHAKSDYPWGVDDHDRPLNDRGRRDAPRIGEWLDQHVTWSEPSAPAVLVSSARRAQQTWALAGTGLSSQWDRAQVFEEPRIYGASVRTLLDVAAEAPPDAETVVLVGHNPGLAGLLDWLCVDDDLKGEALVKFPTSSVAVLSSEGPVAAAIQGDRAFRVTAFAVPRG
jgi:phosphohistidine phosphatase